MNQNAFFDDLILMWLYKKGGVISTFDIEDTFGNIFDIQNVNNVISNRKNTTSYIYKEYLAYDENKKTIKITNKGKKFIEEKYSKPREN